MPRTASDIHERSSRPLASQRRAAVAGTVLCLAVAGYLAVHHRDQVHLRAANELGLQGRYAQAQAEAQRVTRAPAQAQALLIQAYAAQALDRHRQAVALFSRAAEREPRNWSLHRDWAISLQALGQRREARERMAIASTLNPLMPAPPGF
jgi:Flp pilus assembly protein TadD